MKLDYKFTILMITTMVSTAAVLSVISRLKSSVTGVAGDIRGIKSKLEQGGISDEILAELEGVASALEALDAETPDEDGPTLPPPIEPEPEP